MDFDWKGFQWVDCNDGENSVLSFIRRAADPEDFVLVVCNFTPVVRYAYRVGVPEPGVYREILNTDSATYWGSNVGNLGGVEAEAVSRYDWPCSLSLTLPPLGAVFLTRST